ncbi:TPA: hypothetical protein QDC06_000250 [Burkholderia cepacia]|nr:hypothetical protein [Burkholderia cepacia]
MTTYYLSEQGDGRIVLDRECHGALIQTVSVSDPSVVHREIDGEWIEAPQYWESFFSARAKVGTEKLEYVAGEGWFRRTEVCT